jgi:DNA-binding transcriptional regulator YhcF (GntR family)
MIKYEAEIISVYRELFYENWMSDSDFDELLNEILTQTGTSIQQLSDEIQVGIDNGYSLLYQLEMMKKIYKKQIPIPEIDLSNATDKEKDMIKKMTASARKQLENIGVSDPEIKKIIQTGIDEK